MSEYAVRVTIAVEHDDGIGPSETLDLSFASFVPAESPSAAALMAASAIPNRVADALREAIVETA